MPPSNLTCALLDRALDGGLGARAAIREPKRVWTYARLAEEAQQVGGALRSLGIGPGTRVALLLHDCGELAASFLGAIRIGAVPVPVNILLRPLEVRAVIRDSGATAVVVSADLSATVEAVRAELPSVEHVLAVGWARAGQVDFHALVRSAEPSGPAHQPADGEPAFLLYSAGAGATPKGVCHDHAAPLAAHAAYARSILDLREADRVYSTPRLSSAYGLGLGLLFPLLSGSATFLLPARPRPRAIFDVMSAFRPTVFAATPSLYGQMVQDFSALAEPRPSCFGSVRLAVSGGEPLPQVLAERVRQTLGLELVHGFGATEALHFVFSNRPGALRPGSVGSPLESVEARIVDDAGRTLPPEEIGSIEVRGPTVARGYFGADGQDATFHDGWVRTGDRFFVDREGHYFHCGRSDGLFKVGGRWLSPEEVERTLLRHPAVWQCAITEDHDADGLTRPVAFVVANVGHAPTAQLAAQLIDFVKREIAPYKYPRAVEFVDALPMGADGQIQRWRLRRAAEPPGGAASG